MEAEVEPALEAVVVVVVVIMVVVVGFPEEYDPVELELDPDEGLKI